MARNAGRIQCCSGQCLYQLPYTHYAHIDQPLSRLYNSVSNQLQAGSQALDQDLLFTIVKLKKKRLETGLYPADAEIPDGLSYQSFGSTARLATTQAQKSDFRYFDGNLR